MPLPRLVFTAVLHFGPVMFCLVMAYVLSPLVQHVEKPFEQAVSILFSLLMLVCGLIAGGRFATWLQCRLFIRYVNRLVHKTTDGANYLETQLNDGSLARIQLYPDAIGVMVNEGIAGATIYQISPSSSSVYRREVDVSLHDTSNSSEHPAFKVRLTPITTPIRFIDNRKAIRAVRGIIERSTYHE